MTDLLAAPSATVSECSEADRRDASLLDGLDGSLVCVAVDQVTHDVRTFTFEIPGGAGLRFLPGQYLTLRFDVDGVPVERCYTISSAASRPHELSITVKRKVGGLVSNWLHDHFGVGHSVEVSGPYGEFSHVHWPSDQLVLLSAGSGITPSMSILRTLRDQPTSGHDTIPSVRVIHSARTPADIVFRDELDELSRLDRIEVMAVCEADAVDEVWNGPRGRLRPELVLAGAPQLLAAEIMICGPAPYMDQVREMLQTLGVDPARIHHESFVLGASELTEPETEDPCVVDPGGAEAATSTALHVVEFRSAGRSITCDEGTTVLAAANAAGIPVASSCGEGVCGTCKHSLVSGEVDMQPAGGIRPREIREGKFLLCCSTPTSDLVID